MLLLCARHLKKTYPEMAGVSIYGGAPGYGYSNWSNTSSYGLQMDPRDDNATLELIHDTSLLMQEFWPDPPRAAAPSAK